VKHVAFQYRRISNCHQCQSWSCGFFVSRVFLTCFSNKRCAIFTILSLLITAFSLFEFNNSSSFFNFSCYSCFYRNYSIILFSFLIPWVKILPVGGSRISDKSTNLLLSRRSSLFLVVVFRFVWADDLRLSLGLLVMAVSLPNFSNRVYLPVFCLEGEILTELWHLWSFLIFYGASSSIFSVMVNWFLAPDWRTNSLVIHKLLRLENVKRCFFIVWLSFASLAPLLMMCWSVLIPTI